MKKAILCDIVRCRGSRVDRKVFIRHLLLQDDNALVPAHPSDVHEKTYKKAVGKSKQKGIFSHDDEHGVEDTCGIELALGMWISNRKERQRRVLVGQVLSNFGRNGHGVRGDALLTNSLHGQSTLPRSQHHRADKEEDGSVVLPGL